MSWFAAPQGDLTDAKGAETMLSLTGLDEVKAHVGGSSA
jgi:hypothetical protein